jgi:hypothetical protein
MAAPKKKIEPDPQSVIRWTQPGIRDRIAVAAKRNNRSMNAEIVAAVVAHLDAMDAPPPTKVIAELSARVETLERLMNSAQADDRRASRAG